MPGFWITVLFICLLCASVFAGMRLYRSRRRRRILSASFPDSWKQILFRNVSLYRRIPPPLKEGLHDRIKLFLAEKRFEGCNGLAVTDEIRLTIAAQACLLLMNKGNYNYPGLSAVLVYPSMYLAPRRTYLDGGAFVEVTEVRAGESWTGGVVVLAWDQVRRESIRTFGGRNVVLHEFAHQLDQEDGDANGAPVLPHRFRYRSWAEAFEREYRKLRHDSALARESLFDEYGALNPAEFFAVATETFFKKPRPMAEEAPLLYDELKEYYGIDPAEWQDTEKKANTGNGFAF